MLLEFCCGMFPVCGSKVVLGLWKALFLAPRAIPRLHLFFFSTIFMFMPKQSCKKVFISLAKQSWPIFEVVLPRRQSAHKTRWEESWMVFFVALSFLPLRILIFRNSPNEHFRKTISKNSVSFAGCDAST